LNAESESVEGTLTFIQPYVREGFFISLVGWTGLLGLGLLSLKRKKKSLYLIGITGPMGSGKSMVAEKLSKKGYTVFYLDKFGHEVLNNDPEVRDFLFRLHGERLFSKGKSIDRKFLREWAFSDRDNIEKLEALIHPKVKKILEDRLKTCSGIVFCESALLYQAGYYPQMDAVIWIEASDRIRMNRIMERDAISLENVQRIFEAQSCDYGKSEATLIVKNESLDFSDFKKIEKLLASFPFR
jgi:dephospho-CoA kinase